jgi:large subunit ribosomal protein L35
MPKMKTRRGAAKRFSVTGTGKVKRAKAFRRHLLTSKSPKHKRRLRKPALVAEVITSKIRRFLPYA